MVGRYVLLNEFSLIRERQRLTLGDGFSKFDFSHRISVSVEVDRTGVARFFS